MVQWFPDKRGLATGLVAAGYGIGALLTTFPIATRRCASRPIRTRSRGSASSSRVVGLLAAQGLRRPDAAWQGCDREQRAAAPASAETADRRLRRREMLRTPIFWLMFVMMTMMSTSGLMVMSQMGAFTRDFGMADVLVFGLPLLPLALSLDRITNGADAAVLRLGVRSLRPREHDADRLRARRRGDDAVAADARQPGPVRAAVRAWCSSGGARSSRCSRPR